MLLFIHVPKTAGTSFRKAYERAVGADNVFYDYAESPATSDLVRQLEYEKQDRYALLEALNRPRGMLAGHFPLEKYGHLFAFKDIVGFVRRPDQQLRSHFEHHVRNFNYPGTFKDFFSDPLHSNLQSRYLSALPAAAIGLVGLTERYGEALELFGLEYGLDLEVARLNQNSKNVDEYAIDAQELELLRRANRRDFALYERFRRLFERRLTCAREDRDLVRGGIDRRGVSAPKGKRVTGWLASSRSDRCARGVITVNGRDACHFEATDYCPWIGNRGCYRRGHVGFDVRLAKPLRPGDRIELRTSEGESVDAYRCFEEIDSEPVIDPVFSDAQLSLFRRKQCMPADFLREISYVLERGGDYRSAYRAIEQALRLRPNGQAIVNAHRRLKGILDSSDS